MWFIALKDFVVAIFPTIFEWYVKWRAKKAPRERRRLSSFQIGRLFQEVKDLKAWKKVAMREIKKCTGDRARCERRETRLNAQVLELRGDVSRLLLQFEKLKKAS